MVWYVFSPLGYDRYDRYEGMIFPYMSFMVYYCLKTPQEMSWSPHDLHWGLVFWTRAMPTPFLPLVMAQEFGQSSTQIGMVSWHFGGWNMACEMWWILTQTGGKASRNEGNLHKKCCHIHPNGASIASYCSKWWNMAHASNIKDHKTTPRLTALCLNCLEETILSSIFWVFSTDFWRKMIFVKNPVPPNFNRKKP